MPDNDEAERVAHRVVENWLRACNPDALPVFRFEQGEILKLGITQALRTYADARVAAARRVERERAATVAVDETITGIPPLDWTEREISIAEAATRATSKSIAETIRALEDKA